MIDVARNEDRQRYEIRVDGERAGFALYEERPGRIVFTHTVVLPAFEGRGLGSRLARFALEDAVDRGLGVELECPFMTAYVAKHPEFAEAVVAAD